MFHALRHRSESLIETIVAVSVIVLATTASLSLLRTALTGNQVIGEKLVALNLAQEGIEAIRNIRDTNYLNFPTDPDNCWNTLNAKTVEDCPFAEKIKSGSKYFLERSIIIPPLFEWEMVESNGRATDGLMDLYRVEEVDVDGDGEIDPLEIYAQSGLVEPTLVKASAFRRTIDIDYSIPDAAFEATVTVEWDVNGVWQKVALTRTIANVN